MKKVALQIAVLAFALLAVCVAGRVGMKNTYTAYVPIPPAIQSLEPGSVRIVPETPGIVAHGAPERRGNYLRIPIRPQQAGETFLDIELGSPESTALQRFRVGRFGTIYDSATGGFTGDWLALTAFTVFCLLVAAIMLRYYRQARGPAFYAYSTIYAAGFSLFALLTGLLMLYVSVRRLLRPGDFSMLSVYEAISGAGLSFAMLTAPLMLAFAAAMTVSNIALLRHERFRPQNVLGIGIGAILAVGEGLAFWLFTRDFSGSERAWRIHNTLKNVYGTAFAYFECMLIGAIVCGLKAARHVPAMDADYILILGCRFRRDGTLTPLLQGRVDRAIAFWWEQKRRTGKAAVLVPSGGQGSDEVMPEAEAMRNYLLAQGIPEASIRAEAKSRNTYQNMAYSKAMIDAEMPGAKVAYATTNYHVFRSGVWAGLAGLPAEGMGSKTKWWYWPNAFMRECAGLMLNRIPQEALLLAVLVAFFGLLSMALG